MAVCLVWRQVMAWTRLLNACTPGTFPSVTGYGDGGPRNVDPVEWTDETRMALALADSIDCNGWDPDDQARWYLSWMESGEYSVNGSCFDVGITTVAALLRFRQSGSFRTGGNRIRDNKWKRLDYSACAGFDSLCEAFSQSTGAALPKGCRIEHADLCQPILPVCLPVYGSCPRWTQGRD